MSGVCNETRGVCFIVVAPAWNFTFSHVASRFGPSCGERPRAPTWKSWSDSRRRPDRLAITTVRATIRWSVGCAERLTARPNTKAAALLF